MAEAITMNLNRIGKMDKKSFFGLAILLLMASCTIDKYDGSICQEDRVVTVKARMADALEESPSTRTVISNEITKTVAWSPGDRISLFYGTGLDGGSMFTSTNEENESITSFTGSIGVITGGADVSVNNTFFWGLYPYDPEASCDGTTIVTTLNPNQTAVAGTFASGTVTSIARSQNLGLAFYNVCSGLRVRVVKDGVVKMTLKSLDGSPLAGKARIGFDDNGVPYVQEVLEGSDEIVLTAPAGTYLEPGQNYYFMFFPHNFSTSFFTVTFETMTESATYERKKAMNFARSNIEGFNVELDKALTYTPKTGSIPIEDPAFKTWLTSNGFDIDGDGEISYAEADGIEQLWIGDSEEHNIESLQGIEYMPNLTHLYCAGQWHDYVMDDLPEHAYISNWRRENNEGGGPTGTLKKVDVSYNHKLVLLNLSHNEGLGETIGEMDLSNNPLLEEVCFSYNGLKFPDISHLSKLKHFETRGVPGDVPDISGFQDLEFLEISDPKNDHDFNVDVRNCPNLVELIVVGSRGVVLGLDQATGLRRLCINANWNDGWQNPANAAVLQEIIPSLTELVELDVCYQRMGSLDVSNNTKLEGLYCRGNNLTQLDLSANSKLKWLHIADNNIASINLAALNDLEVLYIDANPLTGLDISSNTNLLDIDCSGTGLTALDLSANTSLKYVLCKWNNLTSLDLSNNTALECIDCRWNNITTLDVSKNTALASATKDGDRIGLFCVQNEDSNGVDKLQTLYIAEGQVIPFVTENRKEHRISSSTTITVAPPDGGGENYGGGDENNP